MTTKRKRQSYVVEIVGCELKLVVTSKKLMRRDGPMSKREAEKAKRALEPTFSMPRPWGYIVRVRRAPKARAK